MSKRKNDSIGDITRDLLDRYGDDTGADGTPGTMPEAAALDETPGIKLAPHLPEAGDKIRRARSGPRIDPMKDGRGLEELGTGYNAQQSTKTRRLGVNLTPELFNEFDRFCKRQRISKAECVAIAIRFLLKTYRERGIM